MRKFDSDCCELQENIRAYVEHCKELEPEKYDHLVIDDDDLLFIGTDLPMESRSLDWYFWTDSQEAAIKERVDFFALQWTREAKAIAHACQMTGAYTKGDVTVRPNSEFILKTGSAEEKAMRLQSWPTSQHWYVTMCDPSDTDAEILLQDDVSSWGDVLAHVLDKQRRYDTWKARQNKIKGEYVLKAWNCLRAAKEETDRCVKAFEAIIQ